MPMTNAAEYLERTAARVPDKIAFSDASGSLTFGQLLTRARALGTVAGRTSGLQKRARGRAHRPDSTERCGPARRFAERELLCSHRRADARSAHAPHSHAGACPRDRLFGIEPPAGGAAYGLRAAVCLEEAEKTAPDDALLQARREQIIDLDPVYLLFTSGSTGTPKGIVISHRAILDFTDWLTDFCGYTEHEVFGNQSPFYFDTSCKDLYQTLKLGATCVILEKKFFALPLFLLQALDQHGVTAVNWATSAFHLAASSGALERCVPHALRKIVVGGEALQARYVNMWKRAIPEADLYNMYGPTETTVDCAALHLTRAYRDDEPIPIGKACRNMQLLLLKDDLTEAAPGETGELCVRGSGLAAGYFADAEKTDAAFIQNPLCPDYRDILYRTGDMAVQREDGNFYFLARRDGQIKHMGYRIELGEIETALYSVDGLHDAVCFYDAMRDKIVCVYAGNLDTNTLAKALRTALPKYMLPNVYEKLEALPHNANGKLDRAALKERFLHAQS